MQSYKTVDEYISSFPTDVKAKLEKIRSIIRKHAPEATEKISYGIPTFVYHKNLVHFAGYKAHLGFYPGSEAVAKFADRLRNYKTSKGTIQIPLGARIPDKLIADIVKYRVMKNSKGVDQNG